MTHDEILALPAGRELDALIAEKVMGYSTSDMKHMPISCPDGRAGCGVAHFGLFFANGAPLPMYSADIRDAWEVVEVFHKRTSLYVRLSRYASDKWVAGLGQGEAVGRTAPEAICRAALLVAV